jgi:1,2-diacylglycerol 3-alpha-glucosyltransferase
MGLKQSPLPKIKKISQLKSFFGILFFVISIGIGITVSFITLREDLVQFNWTTFIETSADWVERWPMMLIAIFLLLAVIFTSGLRLHLLIKTKLKHYRFLDSLVFGILARYYVLITPWGLGGQPIVMAMMHQRKIPLGLATSAPMLDLLMMRLAMFIFVLVALIGFGHLVDPLLYLFAWIGFFFTCLLPVILIAGSFHPWFSQLIIEVTTWLIPPKRKAGFQAKLTETLAQYRNAFLLFRRRPLTFIGVASFAIISQFALLAIPYFVMASFNVNAFLDSDLAFSLGHVVMMMAIANTILGAIPTLGSAGAAEFTFTTVFSTFITGNTLFWATFLWRFLLFYFWLFMGVLITLIQGFFAKAERRRLHHPDPTLPLKVYLFNDGFFPIIDGVVKSVDAHARYLLSQGVLVTVVVPFRGDTRLYPYPILAIPPLKIPGFFYPLPYRFKHQKFLEALYYEGPTIYHAHTPFLLGRLASIMGKRYNIPLISTFHSKYKEDFYQATKSRWLANLFTKIIVKRMNQSQAIWTVSKGAVLTMKSYGLDTSHTRIFTNGITPLSNPMTNEEMVRTLHEFHLSESIPIILFVGQIIWQKNIQFIFQTLEALNALNPQFQLVMVGEGRNEKEIQAMAETLALKHPVIFTGKIHDPTILAALYGASTLFFFPSFYDTDGIVMKEAALHHLPTLVIQGSTIASVIKNRDNGIILPNHPQKAATIIKTLLRSPALRKRIGLKAHQTLAFTWNDTLKDLIPSYITTIKDYYSER